jgi:hypothetical protein
MKIIELNETHREDILHLFYTKNYMGADFQTYFGSTNPKYNDAVRKKYNDAVRRMYHDAFSNTYLTGLKQYKALGLQDDDGSIQGLIAFYISSTEPAWYGTMIRSAKDKDHVRTLLDVAMAFHENEGRYKFYTLWSDRHIKLLRRFAFSADANTRYDYFDECRVPAKTKCIYQNFWTILFNRILLPVDTVVRCTYLKREYRPETPIGGNL